jgi:hypothetical protein
MGYYSLTSRNNKRNYYSIPNTSKNNMNNVDDELYDDFIMTISKKIIANLPQSQMEQLLFSILTKLNTIKKESFNYQTNEHYIELCVLQKAIDSLNKLIIYKKEIIDLETENAKLKLECAARAASIVMDESLGLEIDCGIKVEYIKYIEQYGFPDDGVFDLSKLVEIKATLGML